ncbi:MAG: TetR family transcriptional regulator [Thermoleophilia bacterium]|nr:TetR family transcriptional regulator [Thermoleophilia bacterium]
MPRRRPDDRRAELLDALAEVVAERGFARTRVADVAARAGVSVGLLHRYFPSLDEALAEAFAHVAERDLAATRERLAARPPPERLSALLDECLPEAAHSWRVWIDAWGEALHRPALRRTAEDFTARWRQEIAAALRDGEAGGWWRCPDPDGLAAKALACLDGIALHVALHPPPGGVEQAAGWVREIVAAGLEAPDPAPGAPEPGGGDGPPGRGPGPAVRR